MYSDSDLDVTGLPLSIRHVKRTKVYILKDFFQVGAGLFEKQVLKNT